ncbi:MAG: P-II family nitrogen regulator [Desulfovibrio sp.]|nr:P-II family nitrogen regulator [Desulfovibrio sp.]
MATTYTPGKLLVSIVSRNQGETVVAASKRAGARGGTILLAKGTADNAILRMLYLAQTDKDIVLTLLQDETASAVVSALQSDTCLKKKTSGVGFVIRVPGILKHTLSTICELPFSPAEATEEVSSMSTQATHEMICVIVNTGYAEDVMSMARKAGAKGGTILNARGTGREEDVKFFGITIVPEKEMLLVLVEKNQAATVLDAIRKTACLTEPGIGIAFCIDVEQFFLLGQTA